MTNQRKEVETLKRIVSSRVGPDPKLRVVTLELARSLGLDDLFKLRDIVLEQRRGITRPYAEGEFAVMEAYQAVLERECQRAGFRSVAEFERLYDACLKQ